MDGKTFKERASRLEEVNTVLQKMDTAIRAEAFSLLKGYVTGESEVPDGAQFAAPNGSAASEDAAKQEPDLTEAESFFTSLETDKPAENGLAIAAFLYSKRGVAPFSVEMVKRIAERVGITVPTRLDKTLISATREGKALFRRSGKNFYPTVHGENFFKSTYGVAKGRLQ
jgi:hypothetical protein